MTLEEAKKEINRMTEEKWKTYENTCYTITLGEAYGLEEAISILDQVDGVPVGNSDKLTLKELARELRKLFKFRYLTVTDDWPMSTVMMWSKKPQYDRGWNIVFSNSYLGSFNCVAVRNIDLSEYADENGNVDYSKCIVEVKHEDAEER